MTKPKAKDVNALMLPEGGAASAEAQHFVGMPGAYRPGEPVLLDSIGLDLEGARALVKSLGLPLIEVAHGRRKVEPPVPDHFPPRVRGSLAYGEVEGVEVPTPALEADVPVPPVDSDDPDLTPEEQAIADAADAGSPDPDARGSGVEDAPPAPDDTGDNA